MDSRKPAHLPKVLTADEAAEYTGVASGRTFLRWARLGQLAHIKLPSGQVRFRREDIEEMMTPVVITPDSASSAESASDTAPLF